MPAAWLDYTIKNLAQTYRKPSAALQYHRSQC